MLDPSHKSSHLPAHAAWRFAGGTARFDATGHGDSPGNLLANLMNSASTHAPLADLREGLRTVGARETGAEVLGAFRRHALLIAAGGIALRVFLAMVTGLLFTLGLLGFFGLEEVWRQDIAPELKGSVSAPVFEVLNTAVTEVLRSKDLFWTTLGAAFAVWQISGVVRAVGQTLNRIDGEEEHRSLGREVLVSVVAAAAVAALLIAVMAIVRLGPFPLEDLLGDGAFASVASFLIRWILAAAILLVVVEIVVRAGVTGGRSLPWISVGPLLTVSGWVALTLAFGLYLNVLADLGDVYWALLTIFMLAEYLYAAAVVFLAGLVIDRLVRERSRQGA
jgi:membrane protein